MSRKPLKFKQTDVTRALLGAEKAGKDARGVTVNPRDGTFSILFAPSGEMGVASSESVQPNPWDEVLNNASDEKRAT
jgi:hypothetical protein